jgi:glycosyltransferase involved in cell wall biosynthesis
VSHGETGLLVPPQAPDALGGALDALLAEPERAAAMGAAGRAALAERQLTRAAMVDAYLARYAASLDAPPAPTTGPAPSAGPTSGEPPDAAREG